MKISKKVRAEAVLICAIAASSVGCDPYYDEIATDIGLHAIQCSHPALYLAVKAWEWASYGHRGDWGVEWTRVVDAEAESLLRSGWSPS